MKKAIIIGAGPAGLTCAYELLNQTDIKPIIIEETDTVGGLSKTFNYNGNKMDLGGHRFYSSSSLIMKWWTGFLPVQGKPARDDIILDRNKKWSKLDNAPDPEQVNNVMLLRDRISSVLFLHKFFEFPVSINLELLLKLGVFRIFFISISYLLIKIFPIKNELSFEDFIINRFGKWLYKKIYKNYIEKIFGVDPAEVSAVYCIESFKDLSISKLMKFALKKTFKQKKEIEILLSNNNLKKEFFYPKNGPGQIWLEVARLIKEKGGEIVFNQKVVELECKNNHVVNVKAEDSILGNLIQYKGDYFISTMPVKDLINSIKKIEIPEEVVNTANGLSYRNIISTGILLNKLLISNKRNINTINNFIADISIYIQEKGFKVSRIQIYNNWSPYLVSDLNKIWIGLEYFCNDDDELWNMNDNDFAEFSINELVKLHIAAREDILDKTIIKIPNAIPINFGAYSKFNKIIEFTDKLDNLYLTGRNGMHKYFNMDNSIISAMEVVKNIKYNLSSKSNIWNINVNQSFCNEIN